MVDEAEEEDEVRFVYNVKAQLFKTDFSFIDERRGGGRGRGGTAEEELQHPRPLTTD